MKVTLRKRNQGGKTSLYLDYYHKEKRKTEYLKLYLEPNPKTKGIDQAYHFSRRCCKSIREQNLPVTIKYPEMVAQLLPHFDGNEIPYFGKDNLWSL